MDDGNTHMRTSRIWMKIRQTRYTQLRLFEWSKINKVYMLDEFSSFFEALIGSSIVQNTKLVS